MWLSSADWMNRNMMRRVEIAWPIQDETNRARILQECCQMYLDDNHDAWLLNQDGTYLLSTRNTAKPKTNTVFHEQTLSAQLQLLKKYAN